jgi:hypothetical protein
MMKALLINMNPWILIAGWILISFGFGLYADSWDAAEVRNSRPIEGLASGPTLREPVMALEGRLDRALDVD